MIILSPHFGGQSRTPRIMPLVPRDPAHHRDGTLYVRTSVVVMSPLVFLAQHFNEDRHGRLGIDLDQRQRRDAPHARALVPQGFAEPWRDVAGHPSQGLAGSGVT